MIMVMKELILGRAKDIITEADFERGLESKKLRIKFGIDPTGPRLHLGRASTIRRLRNLQDMGHTIVLIIGDRTAEIGDASDKSSQREVLSADQIHANITDYKRQLGLILDIDKVELHYNSEWFDKLEVAELAKLASHFTVAQMIERDNFSKRFKEQKPISLHEFLYPVLQGYDSVAIKADVEVGGTDQLFNMMAGRTLQKHYGQVPQCVVTFDLLTAPDGRKMSTSWQNAIFITDEPADMYGKIMRINDELIAEYYRICTDIPLDVIEQAVAGIAGGANPRDTKASLAREIVRIYHGEDEAIAAEEAFNRQFRDKQPDASDREVLNIKTSSELAVVYEFLAEHGLAPSKSEAKRLIEQGGVRINDAVVTVNAKHKFKSGDILQIGKRRIYELHLSTK